MLKIALSHPNLRRSPFSAVSESALETVAIENPQPTLRQRLIGIREKSDSKAAEAGDFIVELSLFMQKHEHGLLGERIHSTSEMSAINLTLQSCPYDLVVFDVDDTLEVSLDPYFDAH